MLKQTIILCLPLLAALTGSVFSSSSTSAATVWAEWDPVDATEEIRAAIDQAGVGGTVIIGSRPTPWYVRENYGGPTDKTAILLNRANQTFELKSGATIRARKGFFQGIKSTLMRITADGVTVKGAGPATSILAMNKSDYQSSDYIPSQFRSAIDVGGYKDITIKDITINTPGGDGINLGGFYSFNPVIENILIQNVSIWKAHRNGLSVSSVRNSLLENISVWETEGHDPESAIDVELDHTYQRVQNVLVRDSIFYGSKRHNMKLELFNYHNNSLDQNTPTSWVSITFDNCMFPQSSGAGVYFGGPSGEAIDLPKNVPNWCWVNFNNCTVDDSAGDGMQFSHIYADTGMQVWFDDVEVRNSGRQFSQKHPVVFLFGKSGYRLGDIGFYSGCRIVDDRNVDTVFAPNWLQNYGFENLQGSLQVDNSGGSPSLNIGQNLFNVTLNLF